MRALCVMRDNLAVAEERYDEAPKDSDVVYDFLDLFFDHGFFHAAVVLNSRELGGGRVLGVARGLPFLQLVPGDLPDRGSIAQECRRGNLSIWFFPKRARLFLDEFHKKGYYPHVDHEQEIESTDDIAWLNAQAASALNGFLVQTDALGLEVGCAFTHDLAMFCELHLRCAKKA